eukprot:GFUD01034215.1.p1 GENE.GFUD01034215.1~~GFUD01034215.1.p1  ORF type:complete len:309 (+),score=85.82 GFUD01034215.1:43-969(+)
METPAKPASQPMFGLNDTQQMMYAFGDARRPNIETAKLIESVVLNQITEIVHQATSVSHKRSSKTLGLESILFLMRHSPLKIQRLVKYLFAKDISRQTKAAVDGEIENISKSSKRCRDFLETIDEGGKLLAACNEEYFDDIYLERLVRNDKVTRNMDEKKYEEFCKARAVGFRGSYSMKFQASLEEVLNSIDLKVEKMTQDVLSYLAYETLGQLVEMSLLVRRDTCGDPVARLVPLRSVNIEYPSVHLPIPAATPEKPEVTSELSGHPITTAEVREVLRRLQQSYTSDRPLAKGSRHKPVSCMPVIAI